MAHQSCCQYCQLPISASRYRQFKTCTKHSCRVSASRKFWQEKLARERESREKLLQTRKSLTKIAAKLLGERQLVGRTLAFVPANVRPIANLPERRKRTFRDFLARCVSNAAVWRTTGREIIERTVLADDPKANEALVLANGCATCGGQCCEKGRDHAFLSAEQLSRFMRDNPAWRPRDVFAAYLARLPSKAYKDSCVYHTQSGCALPREMRSQICNRFLCTPLKEIQSQLANEESSSLSFIASNGDTLVRMDTCLTERMTVVSDE